MCQSLTVCYFHTWKLYIHMDTHEQFISEEILYSLCRESEEGYGNAQEMHKAFCDGKNIQCLASTSPLSFKKSNFNYSKME